MVGLVRQAFTTSSSAEVSIKDSIKLEGISKDNFLERLTAWMKVV